MQPRSLAIRPAIGGGWRCVCRGPGPGYEHAFAAVPRITEMIAVQVSRSSMRAPSADSSSSSTAPSLDRSSSSTSTETWETPSGCLFAGPAVVRPVRASARRCVGGALCPPGGAAHPGCSTPSRSAARATGSRYPSGGTSRWGSPTTTVTSSGAGLRRCGRGLRAGTDRPGCPGSGTQLASSTVSAIVTTCALSTRWKLVIFRAPGDHPRMRGRHPTARTRQPTFGRCCSALAPGHRRRPGRRVAPRWPPPPASRSSQPNTLESACSSGGQFGDRRVDPVAATARPAGSGPDSAYRLSGSGDRTSRRSGRAPVGWSVGSSAASAQRRFTCRDTSNTATRSPRPRHPNYRTHVRRTPVLPAPTANGRTRCLPRRHRHTRPSRRSRIRRGHNHAPSAPNARRRRSLAAAGDACAPPSRPRLGPLIDDRRSCTPTRTMEPSPTGALMAGYVRRRGAGHARHPHARRRGGSCSRMPSIWRRTTRTAPRRAPLRGIGSHACVLKCHGLALARSPHKYRDSGMMAPNRTTAMTVSWRADPLRPYRTRGGDPGGPAAGRGHLATISPGGYGHPDTSRPIRVLMYAVALAAVPSFRPDLGEPWKVSKVY